MSPETTILQFLREKAADARTWAATRRSSAASWRDATEEEMREGHVIAEQMTGERMPRMSSAEQQRLAEIDERIAVELDREGDLYDHAIAALSLRGEAPAGACDWREDEDGVWDTACGGKFQLSEGAPPENKMRYCPYCGRSLQVRRSSPQDRSE